MSRFAYLNEMSTKSNVTSHGPLEIDPSTDFQTTLKFLLVKESSSGCAAPKFVLDSVSGARPTLNESLSNSVTVRQHPLTQIESPM
jgi:hypothetical protein